MTGAEYRSEVKRIRKERENLFTQKIRESQTYKRLSLSSGNAQTDSEKELLSLLNQFDNETKDDLLKIQDWDKGLKIIWINSENI